MLFIVAAVAAAQSQTIRLYCAGGKCSELTLRVCGEGVVHVNWGEGEEGDYANGILPGKCHSDTVVITMPSTITGFDCEGSCISWIDVNGAPNLVSLNCADNRLRALNVDSLTLLDELVCSDNELERLNTASCAGLRYLDCADNYIDILDLGANTRLEVLCCSGNRLTSLNLGLNDALRGLWGGGNDIGSLDLGLCRDISSVVMSDGSLGSIALGPATRLQDLWLDSNDLAALDFRGVDALLTANVSNNRLEKIDVRNFSGKTQIYFLDVSYNRLPFSSFYPYTKVQHYVCGWQDGIYCGYDSLAINELTDFAALITNAGGNKIGALAAYDAATDWELERGSNTKDYQYLIGRVRFWHEIDSVYFVITSAKYPDLEIRTNNFVVYDPELVGIHSVYYDNGQQTTDNGPDEIYDLTGRKLSSPLKNQIYIRNRKKVLQ